MMKPTCTQSSISSPTEHVSETSCSSSKYKGVRKRKWGKWVSEIRLPNSRERIWLGSYDSAEKAARAFDAALYCLRGPDAKFNFPENPPEITGGRSLSPQEIQEVAARFANEFDEISRTPENNNNDNSSNNNNYVARDQYTPSSSVSMSDGEATAIQVENHETGWSSFLSELDTKQEMSDYGFYLPSDQLYPPPLAPSPPIDDNVDNDQNGFGGNSSWFLWNF